jgi:hypothetical protein
MIPTHLIDQGAKWVAMCGSKADPVSGLSAIMAHVDGHGAEICPECLTVAGDQLPPADEIERRRIVGVAQMIARNAERDRMANRKAAAEREATALYHRLLAYPEWCAAVDADGRLFGGSL